MTDMSLADEVAHYSRTWLTNHIDMLPDWYLRNAIQNAYPGGWVAFLSEYGFIKPGEYEQGGYA